MDSPFQSPPVAPRAKWAEEEVDFYPKWNFFKALGDFHEAKERADDLETFQDNDDTNDRELLLQGYCNGVAYLCDVEKGGNTVTATALDIKSTLYIATNTELPSIVRSFITWVLTKELTKPAVSSRREEVIRKILENAIERAGSRIEFYIRELKKAWGRCRESLEDQFRGDELLSWTESLTKPRSHYHLVVKCYKARGDQLVKLKLAAAGQKDRMDLVHYIGRLGAHNYHVLKIVSAFARYPALQRVTELNFIPSSSKRTISFAKDSPDFLELSRRVSRDLEHPEIDRRELFLHLMGRYYDSGPQLEASIEKTRKIETRVHAEILIIDHFQRNKLKFLNGHRYIGCSKPACYFCHHWLECENVVVSKSHFKVILECRGPDFTGAATKFRQRNYKYLTQQIAESIYKEMSDPMTMHLHIRENETRYQSTEGSAIASTLRSERPARLRR